MLNLFKLSLFSLILIFPLISGCRTQVISDTVDLPSNSEDLPLFFKTIDYESCFPNGMQYWKLKKNGKQGNYYLLLWENSEGHTISLKYGMVTPKTLAEMYKGLSSELDKSLKTRGGNTIEIKRFFGVGVINETERDHSLNILYATPEEVYLWKYTTPKTFGGSAWDYIAKVRKVAREHQYDVALRHGNITMRHWESSIHEFARLLRNDNDQRTEIVYTQVLQTNPNNYDAHMEFTSITDDREKIIQSAQVVYDNAEEKELIDASARILKKDIPSLIQYPMLGPADKGLKVVLIPLSPCNPWLLKDIATVYEEITSIPVIVRQLPVTWDPPEPSRSTYRPMLEQIASNILKTKSDFTYWPLAKLKEEIMKKAQEQGPQSVWFIRQLFKRMDEKGYQWDAEPLVHWLSAAISSKFSQDSDTMVVGITGLDIYARDAKYVFSSFGGQGNSPVSILSYARMTAKLTGQNQSRKLLVERTAKELVPAGFKKLRIPRSIDPTCPYSYANSLRRVDEKSLTLSDQVKKEIQRRKHDK